MPRGAGKDLEHYPNLNQEQRQELKNRAYELRLNGWTYPQIGQELRVHYTTVRTWCLKIMATNGQENREALKALSLARIDRLQVKANSVMAAAELNLEAEISMMGFANEKTLELHLKSNARVQSLEESRRKLLGLDAAEKHEVEHKGDLTEAERKIKRMVAEYRERNQEQIKEMRQ